MGRPRSRPVHRPGHPPTGPTARRAAPAFPAAARQPGGPHFPGAQPGGPQPGTIRRPAGPTRRTGTVRRPPRPHGLALAPLGLRLVARLVDIGIVFLLNVVVNGWFVWQFVREIAPISEEFTRRLLTGETSARGYRKRARGPTVSRWSSC